MKCRYFCRLPLDISPVYLTRGISISPAAESFSRFNINILNCYMLVLLRFVSLFLKPLPIQLSNNLRRVSGDDGVGGDVFGCYAGGAYDGVFADGDPWKDGNSGAVPGVFADAHILHCEDITLIKIMIVGKN